MRTCKRLECAAALLIAGCAASLARGDDGQVENSPRGVFLAQNSAIKAHDWRAYYALETPAKRARNFRAPLVAVCAKAFLRPGDPTAMRLIEKHRIPIESAREVAIAVCILDGRNESRLDAELATIMKQVDDRLVDVLADCTAFMFEQDENRESTAKEIAKDQKIADIVIDGDRATASLVDPDPTVPSRKLHFEKIQGRWFSALP